MSFVLLLLAILVLIMILIKSHGTKQRLTEEKNSEELEASIEEATQREVEDDDVSWSIDILAMTVEQSVNSEGVASTREYKVHRTSSGAWNWRLLNSQHTHFGQPPEDYVVEGVVQSLPSNRKSIEARLKKEIDWRKVNNHLVAEALDEAWDATQELRSESPAADAAIRKSLQSVPNT